MNKISIFVNFAVFLCLSSMKASGNPRVSRQTAFTCPSQGKFADSADATVYYVCYQNGGKMYAYKFTCPPGSSWVQNIGRCVVDASTTLDPTATTLDPTANTVDPTATTLDPTATTLDPTATTVDPTATTLDPTATTLDPTATTVDPTATTLDPTATTVDPTATTETEMTTETTTEESTTETPIPFYQRNPSSPSLNDLLLQLIQAINKLEQRLP